MAITRTAITDDDGTGTTGTVLNAAWKTEFYDQIDAILTTAPLDISGASAGQIKFPATQNPSTNANTLDDYEEGTWTPVIGGSGGTSGQTYTTQYGRYIKIGKLVTAFFDCTLSAKGTITGTVQINGQPFTADAGGTGPYVGAMQWDTMATTQAAVQSFMLANGTSALLRAASGGAVASMGTLATADINNTTTLRGILQYVASA